MVFACCCLKAYVNWILRIFTSMVYYDYAGNGYNIKLLAYWCVQLMLSCSRIVSHTVQCIVWVDIISDLFFHDILAVEIVLYSYVDFTCRYAWNDCGILLATDLCEQSYCWSSVLYIVFFCWCWSTRTAVSLMFTCDRRFLLL